MWGVPECRGAPAAVVDFMVVVVVAAQAGLVLVPELLVVEVDTLILLIFHLHIIMPDLMEHQIPLIVEGERLHLHQHQHLHIDQVRGLVLEMVL